MSASKFEIDGVVYRRVDAEELFRCGWQITEEGSKDFGQIYVGATAPASFLQGFIPGGLVVEHANPEPHQDELYGWWYDQDQSPLFKMVTVISELHGAIPVLQREPKPQ